MRISGNITLKEVREECRKHDYCKDCIYGEYVDKYFQCAFQYIYPSAWDIVDTKDNQKEQSAKHDAGKVRPSLVFPSLIRAVKDVRDIEMINLDENAEVDTYSVKVAMEENIIDYIENPKGVVETTEIPILFYIARCTEMLIEAQFQNKKTVKSLKNGCIPFPSFIRAVAAVRAFGIEKYHSVESWKSISAERYRDALCRHWLEYIDNPEKKDDESGLPHLWHVGCNVMFLIELECWK